MFRRDYVELSYEIENIDESQIRGKDYDEKYTRFIYERMSPVLKKDADLYILDYITNEKPEKGVYLRCEVQDTGWRLITR